MVPDQTECGQPFSVPLFSYGTLQLPEVQRQTYGRLLVGRVDVLAGFELSTITINNPEVVRRSAAAQHPIVVPSQNPSDHVRGTVFMISEAELAATDEYETDQYARVWIELESGAHAWVYAQPQ